MKFFFVGESPEKIVTRNELWMRLSSRSLEVSVDDANNVVDDDDDDEEEEDPG